MMSLMVEYDTMASFFNFAYFLSYSTSFLSFYTFGQSSSETKIQYMILLVNILFLFCYDFIMTCRILVSHFSF